MKAFALVLLLCFSFSAKCTVTAEPQDKYWFMDNLVQTESSGYRYAVNKRTKAAGLYQIAPGVNGGLEYYNTFNVHNYVYSDLFCPVKSKKIATWIMSRNLEVFDGCEVKAVNSYNMGIGNTRKNRLYFQYCTNILGYMMVSNWLDDYLVTHKSKNKKVWYLRRK